MTAFGTSEGMGVDGDRPQHTTEARSNILYISHSSFNRTLPPDHLHTRTAPCTYCAAVGRRLCRAGADARASRRVPGPGGCRLSFGSRHKHLECNVATISLAVSVGSSGSRLMTIGRGLRSRARPQTADLPHGSHFWTTGAVLWSAVLQTSCGADAGARHPLKM